MNKHIEFLIGCALGTILAGFAVLSALLAGKVVGL